MSHFVSIFLLLACFVEIAFPLAKKEWREYHLISKNKERVFDGIIMAPSKNLTKRQKDNMMVNCKNVYAVCNYAEECCSEQCVKRYKRCIHFWG